MKCPMCKYVFDKDEVKKGDLRLRIEYYDHFLENLRFFKKELPVVWKKYIDYETEKMGEYADGTGKFCGYLFSEFIFFIVDIQMLKKYDGDRL